MGGNTGKIIGSLGMFAATVGLAVLLGGESGSIAGLSGLVVCAIAAIGMQWIGFIPAALKQTESFYDIVGSVTYLTVVSLALFVASENGPLSVPAIVTAAMVAIWTLRLGIFLFQRIHRAGRDPRFDIIKTQPAFFFFAWTAQGLWVFMTLIAVLITLTGTAALRYEGEAAIPLVTWIGWGIWVLGFGIEVVADRQKSAFNANPEKKGRWIDSGLWRLSQHPNYFGEWLLWTGLFIAGIPGYDGLEWLACLSPIFVYILLTRGSGIPLLDEQALKKWGDNPEYMAYRERTSAFVCWPPRA
jgi:steroid 5-alpha reductase family enzyme